MHSWYEAVNKLFMELKHLPDYWHQPQVQEKSYEECNSANSGCITQFCFPAMGKKIGVMWHHLKMLVSTLGQPYKSGIYRKGGRAVQKTLLSVFRVTAGPFGAIVQIRKVLRPRTFDLPMPETVITNMRISKVNRRMDARNVVQLPVRLWCPRLGCRNFSLWMGGCFCQP